MKNIKIAILLLLSMFVLPVIAQNFEDASTQFKEAISKGNHAQLSKLFSDSVDLTVRDTDGIFSKKQATGVLKSFFQKNRPISFEIKHEGSSNDGTIYSIGNYVSNKGSYRVYALFKEMVGSVKLVQLQIEEEN